MKSIGRLHVRKWLWGFSEHYFPPFAAMVRRSISSLTASAVVLTHLRPKRIFGKVPFAMRARACLMLQSSFSARVSGESKQLVGFFSAVVGFIRPSSCPPSRGKSQGGIRLYYRGGRGIPTHASASFLLIFIRCCQRFKSALSCEESKQASSG
jgi:hypothetical protein